VREEVFIRPGQESDYNFVMLTLMKNYKFNSPFAYDINEYTLYSAFQQILPRVFDRPGNMLYVAALKEEPDVILGFIWANSFPKTIWYTYVKKGFRKMGFGKALYDYCFDDSERIHFPLYTPEAKRALTEYKHFAYNPFLLDDRVWKRFHVEEADRQNNL
jgi:GNAT superfamily N-acetyltransferase